MIDLHDLRERPEAYADAARKKRAAIDIPTFLALDKSYRELKSKVESDRAKQNAFNKELPKLKGDEKASRIAEMKSFSTTLKEDESRLREIESEWEKLSLLIPSIPHESVPVGKDDSENVEIRKWGKIPEFSFTPKDHIAIGKALDIIDVERGVKVSGSRNYFLKGDGARLQHAVLQFALSFMKEKGYLLMEPPHLVKYEAMMGTGYFPGGEDQAYSLDERDAGFFLIGTSEVSVASYHMDEILDASELPKRYAGYSPCYRREAGTYGKDTQGLYRIHQFYKVEQVVVCESSVVESAKFHDELLGNAEELLQRLEVPYRVVAVCTGDLGLGQVKKNDIESWMPSRNAYGETHSCSTFHEFQARRLKLRYRNSEGKINFCHTLNNTLVASPRILISILENNQKQDGTISIPKVLQPYMGGQTMLSR